MASKRKQVAKQRRQQRRNRGGAGKGTSKYAEKVASRNMMYGPVRSAK